MRIIYAVGCATAVGALFFIAATFSQVRPQPRLTEFLGAPKRPLVLDRSGHSLRYTYAEEWNFTEQAGLDVIPPFLVSAVIAAEDARFYSHSGVDWLARMNGLWLNLRKLRVIRGASTISEQVVRMIYPRPRSLWSKWLEGWEARKLEAKNSKSEILQFYLNQVPFNERRRGVVQAARGFFDRDLSVLNKQEMLTLSVMIKNPSRMGRGYLQLGEKLREQGLIDDREWENLLQDPVQFAKASPPLAAPHFLAFVETQPFENPARTTLDSGLQTSAQKLINEALKANPQHELNNAALIVVDHQTDEILVWAVGDGRHGEAAAYNAPLVPRQPGSSLKPFLYATAFEAGFAPETLVEDSPLSDAVGAGLHNYRNYSRHFYGWLTIREALANSLNIPGIRVIKQIGVDVFLNKLKLMRMDALKQSAAHYGEGLALGNGEVPLFEMIGAYATLARGGIHRSLRVLASQPQVPDRRVFSEKAAKAVNAILSDANSRRLEFGRGGNLEFPLQTAVKTGTSTDFRDAWAFAYNYKFVAGIWMGNLDNRPTQGLSGSTAPMLVLRAILNEALRGQTTEKLSSPSVLTGLPSLESEVHGFRISKPGHHTHMAIDPRVPPAAQAFTFEVEGHVPERPVSWWINGQKMAGTRGGKLTWPLSRGRFEVVAKQGGQISSRVFHVR